MSIILRVKNAVLGHRKPITTEPFSFEVHTGETIGIIGRNGAGKSTLINSILGEKGLLQGNIDLGGLGEEPYKKIAFVPQEHIFPRHFRVCDLLEFVSKSENIGEFAEKFELGKYLENYLYEISSGERQRAFLAAALIQKPLVLILDEPTNHLDPTSRRLFWKALQNKDSQVASLISTHDLSEVKTFCSRVIAIKQGNLVFDCPAARFFADKLDEQVY